MWLSPRHAPLLLLGLGLGLDFPPCWRTGYQPTLKIYGKPVTQSRKIAAFATDPDLDVKYSGTTVQMSYDYPPLLREIQDLVEAKLNVKFNHVMLNLYENGRAFSTVPLFRVGRAACIS